jgi:hypothetical protein
MNANTNSPTATIGTPIPTESFKPTATVNNHPSESPSDFPTSSIQPTASADSVMINEQNYFKFGMSRNSVKKELKKLGIKISDEGSASEEFQAPDGFYTISTDKMEFDFNDQNQLYSITLSDGETLKGLKIGDPAEEIQQIYGKPDEIQFYINSLSYMYHCGGYMFSVGIDTKNDTVSVWSIFLNIWNDANSYGITNAMYGSDDSIQFNEENFSKLFTFGMSRKALESKLTGLGIRIDSETYDQMNDADIWGLQTDHVLFGFDKGGLCTVYAQGWETAKGLQIGDSIEKLHQLYGQENSIEDGYIYNLKGYKFDVSFDKNNGLDSWLLFTRR